MYEGQTRFDVIYGTVSQGNTSATAGVQKNNTAFDQYFCNGSGGRLLAGKATSLHDLRNTNSDSDANGDA